MSEVKHTPGPWTAEFYDYGDELWFGGSGAGMWSIGPAYLGGDGPEKEGLERMEADARLIAAAPDLLEALRELVSACTRYDEQDEHRALLAANYCAAKDKAIAVIAKAEAKP